MSVTVGAIGSWFVEIDAAMTALPAQLEQAGPRGDFASVLHQAVAILDAGPRSANASASTTVRSSGIGADQAAPTSSDGATNGGAAVSEAEKFLGVPYVWGGDSPSGFDCSGLVQYVYSQLGVSLPRTTYTQVKVGAPVASLTQARPGDLVFFAGSDGTTTAPGHVGIYLGNGKMIDAPYTGTVVQVQTVSAAGAVVAIRRILPATAPMSSGPMDVQASATPASTGPVAVPANMAPFFVAAGARYGISPTLLAAIARQESGFTPRAVSTAGAQGMMQLMPGTAAGLGITPFTPAQAVDGAAKLMSGYIRQFRSVPLALAAYNAGPGAVEGYGGVPPYPETQRYVAAIMTTLGASA